MNLVEFLTEARGLIKEGWCQGSFRKITDNGVEYCALGAMGYVGTEHHVDLIPSARRVFAQLLPEQYFEDTWPMVARWNDEPGRTQEEVLGMFDKAIAYLAVRGG
jgi:hypothetical protein